MDETVEEKDLGVYVNIGLKPSTQCTKSANRAMSVLRMVTRNFPKIDRVYRHGLHTWLRTLSYLRETSDEQRNVLLVWKAWHMNSACSYWTLKERRQRENLIEVYKILTDREDMDPTRLFQFASRDFNLRDHHLKLYKKQCRLNVRKITSCSESSVCGTHYQTM